MKTLRTVAVCLLTLAGVDAQAQSWQMNTQSYALKAGESAEVMDLYWVINCRSQLTAIPEVAVLDGPPGVVASSVEAQVLPRFQQCSRPVKGAKLIIKADHVDDPSNTVMTVRITYRTKDGERQRSVTFNLALFPAS